MKRIRVTTFAGLAAAMLFQNCPAADDRSVDGSRIDRMLAAENSELGVEHSALPLVDDFAFLRRIYVDLVGRIPSDQEIQDFLALPETSRRTAIVDRLLQHERYVDTWTTFFADILRLRSNADGGGAAIAFVHKAIQDGMPYDDLARRMISANGKAGATPEVGFVLGDNADPMALAGATSQVFLGIRISCAQCHDHPFDVWTQKDFYGLAAYFGKTRRVETQLTNTVYTTEADQSTVLWPPEGMDDGAGRQPMTPTFPFRLAKGDSASKYIARLEQVRLTRRTKKSDQAKTPSKSSVDDLLASLDNKVNKASRGKRGDTFDIAAEARRDVRELGVRGAIYRESELRAKLAELITDPRNRYFSRCFVNRVWAHLVGRGFVEPVDDFSDDNPPTHPKTLDFLADEFVAGGYDLKALIRMVVTSRAYQRSHAVGVDEVTQAELEGAFLATPMRRMISEVIYDSVVTAGHLFDVKHPEGENLKTVWQYTRVMKERNDEQLEQQTLVADTGNTRPAMTKSRPGAGGYNLEKAIELDFDSLLRSSDDNAVEIDRMQAMSKEEIEAERMQAQMRQQRRGAEYIDRFVKTTVDDNPTFGSSFRMASPAAPEHFLRVFGQTDRSQLGETRDHSPSMRQALMMLNGRLSHEASRVGALEPIYALVAGEQADLDEAIRLAYREILTREPSAAETSEARSLVNEADSPLDGVADLRWILLNCNEFRFLP